MHTNFVPTSDSSSPQPQRLPVNPRRHKVAPDQRKRVPCQRCHKTSRECEYPAPESDKLSLKDELERLRRRCAALEAGFQSAAPEDAAELIAQLDHAPSASRQSGPTFPSVSMDLDQPDANDGRLLVDPCGTQRFLGETSGATFLDYLKQFMLTLVPLTFHPESADGSSFVASIGRYQTYDSRPIPNPNVDPLWLPDWADMNLMLAELRSYVQDGKDGFLSGGIYSFYHVCFALATSIGHPLFRKSDQHAGEAYFKRARKLLGNPLDTVRFTLSDVPVLTLMGFYLIELNRRDAAYVYVSLAIHIAMIHGAFRSCKDEENKRIFWTLYILDRWLAVLMGRPPTIADEAIRIPLPCDEGSLPPSVGLRAHVELSRIAGYIVCETFKIAPRNFRPGYSVTNIDKALKMLEEWNLELPSVLASGEGADSAVLCLHMASNQLIVLTTRPILLAAVKQAVAERYINGQWSLQTHVHGKHIHICIEAAHQNIMLAQRLCQVRKLLQAGLHFVFNAGVVLLLEQILHYSGGHKTPTPSIHTPEIEFTIRTFENESRTGTNYPRDCFKVLQDLKALVDRYLSHDHGRLEPGSYPHGASNIPGPPHAAPQDAGMQGTTPGPGENNGLYQEMRTWMQNDGLQMHHGLPM
ncbi:hypothetical protein COCCADRAFT_89204 [Bipolaris zeicola 26-R-13]|uniref:Xylanolytic transcriptional activator regulatory domain-containing protein n=1 Tax=Cochliobolus carbonum (strain 26-R-13) TaxID=930089 RepID=W6Y8Z9_COCC2|nr:uncharacterized protein COCCADRAFT_89204 [Bipolaris zeicola 26-R-13]EUC36087.1 hypothetical protein COCCADRAFT_89204 [Bipolaris zeicola 26-R-13]